MPPIGKPPAPTTPTVRAPALTTPPTGGTDPKKPGATTTGAPNSPATTTPGASTTPDSTPAGTTDPLVLNPFTAMKNPAGLDANFGAKNKDVFENGPLSSTTGGTPTEKKYNEALNVFQTKIETTLHHDALSMANGHTPWTNGDPISGEQQKALTGAATDFITHIPLNALAPGVLTDVEKSLSGRGIQIENLGEKSLSDVGKIAGDIASDKAKELANGLKENSPVAYYGLIGGAAVAVGAYGYSKGSASLEKLGIKPEIKTGFFNDHVTARVRAAWEPGFKNATFGGTVRANFDVNQRMNFSTEANFDKNKFVDLRLASTIQLSNTERFAVAAGVNDMGKLAVIGARYDMLNPDRGFSLSAGGHYDFSTDKASADLQLRYQPNANLDVALTGRTDFQGDSRVGVGVRWRF